MIALVYVLNSRTRQSLTWQNVRAAFLNLGRENSQVQDYSGSAPVEKGQTKPS